MRLFYLLILVVLIAAIALFAWQNTENITLKYWDRTLTSPLALIVGVAYLLGMVSGWTVVGLAQRSWRRVTEYKAR